MIETIRCKVKVRSGGSKKNDRGRPVAPSLEYAQPEPLAPAPRIDAATDEAYSGVDNVGAAVQKTDPKKVADRVYELMQRELLDARHRGGARR